MKKVLRRVSIIVGLALLIIFVSANDAGAAEINLNGRSIDAEASGDMVIRDGVTMVSEDFLQDEMYLTLEKDGKSFRLENTYKDFVLEGATDSDVLRLNGEEKKMSKTVQSVDGQLFLPLRPVIEWFGDIGWVDRDQTVYARFDYNDQLDLPLVQVSDESVKYDRPTDFLTVGEGETPILMTDDGTIVEKRDENNNLIAIQTEDEVLIQPQHEDNILRWGSYEIEEDYLYWMEQPNPSFEITDDQKWYLYIQERKTGAQPKCIDSGSYNEVLTVSPTGGMLNNSDFKNGNIIWLRGDKSSGQFEARLYQHDTGEVTTLERLPFDENIFTSVTMEVAIGENDVFWTRAYFMEGMREYGIMKRMHLDTGEVEEFSRGYNLLNPFIAGDYLIIRAKPEGNNWMPNPEKPGTDISGELWVYDLNKNEWRFKVDNHLEQIGEQFYILTPVLLDDTHISVRTNHDTGYSMPIIDLEQGTIHEIMNENSEPLIFNTYGLDDEMIKVGDIHSISSDGSCMATFRNKVDGATQLYYEPVYFQW